MLAPFALPKGTPQTIDVHYFPDDRSVIVLLAGGDIAVLQLDDPAQGSFVRLAFYEDLTPGRGRRLY